MNSFNYQTLSFNNADYSYGSNGSMQQSTSYLPQSVSKTCDYNCICCARFHVGNPCPCNTPKTSIGTQTDLEVPQGLDSERFWKRGTYEHSILQVKLELIFLYIYKPLLSHISLKKNEMFSLIIWI